MYSKISHYADAPDIARYIYPPPDTLRRPMEGLTLRLLRIVGRKTLYLSGLHGAEDVEFYLSPDDTAIFNSLQQLTAAMGREATFSTGEVLRTSSARHHDMHESIFTRTIRFIEDFSQEAGMRRAAVIERVGREGKSVYGSGSGVRYRFNQGLGVKDLRSPELMELLAKAADDSPALDLRA